jgi:hypothetical protein
MRLPERGSRRAPAGFGNVRPGGEKPSQTVACSLKAYRRDRQGKSQAGKSQKLDHAAGADQARAIRAQSGSPTTTTE